MPTLRPTLLPTTNDLVRKAENLGFAQWHDVQDRVSVADLFPSRDRCGIYVLSLSDGWAYVGKTVDVTRRYAQHRHSRHADMETMTFKTVPQENLDDEENVVVQGLRSGGIELRNILLQPLPQGLSDFDLVMPAEAQYRWRDDPSDPDWGAPRSNDSDLRRRLARRYQEFLQCPQAEEAVRVLREYVCRGLPAIAQSEMSFWACSCLPGRGQYQAETYARINIYRQEVFTVFVDAGQLAFSWHLTKSTLVRAFGASLLRMRRAHPAIEVDPHFYRTGGTDQIALCTTGTDVALNLMRDPEVLRSIRLFNLHLMTKGRCKASRYHCFDLADRFYEPTTDSLHDG